MSIAAPEPSTEAYVAQDLNGGLSEDDARKIRGRVRDGREDRRKNMEPLWAECLEFAQGKHWLVSVDRGGRRQLILPKLPKGRLRYTVDELSQYRQTVLGELGMDDDRPQVLFRQEDQPDEAAAEQANDLLAYAWESEVQADEALEDGRRYLIDMGTSAVRVRFDPLAGPVRITVPVGPDGQAQLAPDVIKTLQDTGALPDGSLPKFKTMHEGRGRWEPGSGFNIIVPPGVHRERDFPWECWVAAEPVDSLVEEYPAAKGIKADELADINQMSDRENVTASEGGIGRAQPGKLTDHVLVFTYYERPCAKYGKGRVVVMAGEKMQVIATRDQLDYKAPDGTYRSGVHYFHYIRLSNRFWSKGLVEAGMDPQRVIEKLRTTAIEIAARSLPKVYAAKGSITRQPEGLPLEVVWMDPRLPKPVIDNGPGVPAWLDAQVQAAREDLSRAIGVRDVSLGENPAGVNTYSGLALLRDQDGRKLDPVVGPFDLTVGKLCEDTLYDIARYWPDGKQVAIAGPDGALKAFEFKKTMLPDFYRVQIARGASKPRGQGAQLKMVEDIATYAQTTNQPLPVSWVKESMEAGKPVDLPPEPQNDQEEKARVENTMIWEGQQPQVDYFDDHPLHIIEVRSLQTQARLTGRQDVWDAGEVHARAHMDAAAKNAALMPPPPVDPNAQPGGQPPTQPQ